MGVEAGVPDIFVAVPRGTFGGLWLEFKAPKGIQRPEQKDWEHNLSLVGYKYEVHRSWATAWNSTIQYLGYPNSLLVTPPLPLPVAPKKPPRPKPSPKGVK